MDQKKELIDQIVQIEWDLFHKVSNVGGPAECQSQETAFKVNRYAQAMNWSVNTLESYLADLKESVDRGRNLMSEKYARMMETTHPKEYQRLIYQLPALDPDVHEIVGKIMAIIMPWEKELYDVYPHVESQGRPLYTSEDTENDTSIETYLRGELSTYSMNTLQFYYADTLEYQRKGMNGSKLILERLMKSYGFSSLEAAEEAMASRDR